MKRSRALSAALIVLYVWLGSSGPAAEQKEIKQAFIQQLII
jgi:hypothetical protein